MFPVVSGVAQNQAAAAAPANPIPALAITNLGATFGGTISGTHALTAVAMWANRNNITGNAGDTLQMIPTVTLAGGASIASDTIQFHWPVYGSGVLPTGNALSGHLLGGAILDWTAWLDNVDAGTFGGLGGATDAVLANSSTIAASASLGGATVIPNSIFAQLGDFSATGALPAPELAAGIGSTLHVVYSVVDSNGNTGNSPAVVLTLQ